MLLFAVRNALSKIHPKHKDKGLCARKSICALLVSLEQFESGTSCIHWYYLPAKSEPFICLGAIELDFANFRFEVVFFWFPRRWFITHRGNLQEFYQLNWLATWILNFLPIHSETIDRWIFWSSTSIMYQQMQPK